MQQFEYTRFCLEREESQERDTRESKRKSRTDAVLPTDIREQPRSQGPLSR